MTSAVIRMSMRRAEAARGAPTWHGLRLRGWVRIDWRGPGDRGEAALWCYRVIVRETKKASTTSGIPGIRPGTPPERTSRSGCALVAICPLQVVAVDRLLTPPAPCWPIALASDVHLEGVCHSVPPVIWPQQQQQQQLLNGSFPKCVSNGHSLPSEPKRGSFGKSSLSHCAVAQHD